MFLPYREALSTSAVIPSNFHDSFGALLVYLVATLH